MLDRHALVERRGRLRRRAKGTALSLEQSSEGLGENQSIPRRIADESGAEHCFCDPDSKQRSEMGYQNRQDIGLSIFQSDEGWSLSNDDEITAKAGAIEVAFYFPMRERFWLERLVNRL